MIKKKIPKILIITATLDYGGVQHLIVNTAKALAKKGNYKPIVLNLSGKGELVDELTRAGIEHISFGQGIVRKNVIYTLLKTRKLIKTLRPDIVHTHQLAGDFYGSVSALGLNIPVVSHVHNPRIKGLRKIVRYITSRWFTNAFIVTEGERARELKHWIPAVKDKVFLLYNAIDPQNLVLPSGFNKDEYRKQLSIPEDAFVLGTVGRLIWEKGYDLLLPAFKKVLEKTPDSFLVLVGDGPKMEELKSLAQNLSITNRIIFTGYRKDVAAIMSVFDIFVVSSRIDSFPLVTFEAMHLGIPVVITNKVLTKDLFAPASVVVSFSEESLCGGILLLIQDPQKRKDLILKGKRLVNSQFTMDTYITKLEKIYNAIIHKNL